MVRDHATALPTLLAPARLRDIEIRNRMWLAPLCPCMVEAEDGVPTDWHVVRLGARAAGGFGLVVTEATAGTPTGRSSPRDTGLWNDEQAAARSRIGRAALREPGRPQRAAHELGGRDASLYPGAYRRGSW